eukprot:1159496-Pelagomonas_calceolata.AAC.8
MANVLDTALCSQLVPTTCLWNSSKNIDLNGRGKQQMMLCFDGWRMLNLCRSKNDFARWPA